MFDTSASDGNFYELLCSSEKTIMYWRCSFFFNYSLRFRMNALNRANLDILYYDIYTIIIMLCSFGLNLFQSGLKTSISILDLKAFKDCRLIICDM